MNAQTQIVPEGMMENIHGAFVPLAKVEDIDIARNDMVNDVFTLAKKLHDDMVEAKQKIMGEITAFVELSLEMYDVKQGGKQGNMTLYAFNGHYKIQVAMQDNLAFDERLQAAKELIDECITDWTGDSNDNVKALINNAFQVDKEGNISTSRVLGLRRLKIKDEKWVKAMEAMSDSIQIVTTKQYVRIYERNEQGKYDHLGLDFAGV
jgi:hypothetical protein